MFSGEQNSNCFNHQSDEVHLWRRSGSNKKSLHILHPFLSARFKFLCWNGFERGFISKIFPWRHFQYSQRTKSAIIIYNKRSDTQQKNVYFEISRLDLTVSLLSLVTEKSWYSWTFTKIKTVNEANRVNSILISAQFKCSFSSHSEINHFLNLGLSQLLSDYRTLSTDETDF